ncbi:hypothetical protein KFU94_35740 [Chloroflexi bacterium TSY]|nr:hypothetical protein [Chloroflexi bacterium TSY]
MNHLQIIRIHEIWRLWEETQAEPDEIKRNALFQEMLNIHKAQTNSALQELRGLTKKCPELPGHALYVMAVPKGRVEEELIERTSSVLCQHIDEDKGKEPKGDT